MKIAIFTDSFYPKFDGVVSTILKTTDALAKRGHEFYIFAPKYPKLSKTAKPLQLHENIQVKRFSSVPTPGYESFRISIPNFIKARKILKEFKPDVIHIESPGSVGILGINLGKYLNKKIIITYHTYIPDFLVCVSPASILHITELLEKLSIRKIKEKVDQFLEQQKISNTSLLEVKEKIKENRPRPAKQLTINFMNAFHNKADIVTTPSLAMKRLLKKEKLKAPVIFMSNGIQCDFFTPKLEYTFSKKIVHVGRISYEKNIEVVIFAMKHVLERFPDATLDIYGTGPAKKYLETVVRDEKLTESIHFKGFVENSELPKIYQAHDLFVTASTIETQGLVVLEAMSCGLPVVGVDQLALPDLIKNGVNGYVVEPFKPEKMARVINSILDSNKKQEQFGKASVKLAKEHDFNKIIDQMEELYETYST